MIFYCDNKRHLVCMPYSIENLHIMVKKLKIKKYWFHKNHYDIPKRRIEEITKKCNLVSPKEIVRIMKEETQKLELRMYFLVPYNISPIQQAIQAGHAALEYAHKYHLAPQFINFVENYKTWIILNGGTTSDVIDVDGCYYGTLNRIESELQIHNIRHTSFREPDLNNALTAICFILDERVFNKKDYPDFVNWLSEAEDALKWVELRVKTTEELKETFPAQYKKWVDFIGGENNVILRDIIKDKRLA